jgi:hypothetical protein
MSEPTEIVQRVNRALSCSACGAAGYAACDCGAPYLPAATRAAKAIAENPNKSDRAIAAEIGVSDRTVNRARNATATHDAVETRIGLDGKARKQPAMKAAAKSEPETEQPRRRTRLERELDAGAFNRLRDEQAHNEDLAEKLRMAEIKIAGLESEVEELKIGNARLRAELEAKQETATEKQGEAVMPKRGRGRPPGSKNKKPPPAEAVAVEGTA